MSLVLVFVLPQLAGAQDFSYKELAEQRRLLMDEMVKARAAGVGTKTYEQAWSDLETELRTSSTPDVVLKKFARLREQIDTQIAQQKTLHAQRPANLKVVSGKQEKRPDPEKMAVFLAALRTRMSSVWRPCHDPFGTGFVRLRFQVGSNGNIGNASVFMTSGNECFDDTALQALHDAQPVDVSALSEVFKTQSAVSVDMPFRYHPN